MWGNKCDELSKLMIKDTNEVLKFLVFLLNLVAYLPFQSEAMPAILTTTAMYIATLGQLDADKLLFVLKHFFLSIVLERLEKIPDINQYLAIRVLYAMGQINDRTRTEILHLVLSNIKSKETMLKFFEVWTDQEQSLPADRPREGTVVAKGMLKETKLTSSVTQRAFFFKTLVNIMECDLPYVEKMFNYYEDMLHERHNEPLKAVIVHFLSRFYVMAFRREMQQITQEKTQFGKDPKAQLEQAPKARQSPNQLGYILKKIEDVLGNAGQTAFKVFFENIGELLDSSVRLLELYVSNMLRHSEADICCYFDRSPPAVSQEELQDDAESETPPLPPQGNAWLRKEFLGDSMRFSWIIFSEELFNNDVFSKNSASIISYLLKSVSVTAKDVREDTFWYILRFCFSVCKFESLNFEYFDFIMNAAFKLLMLRIQAGVYNKNLEDVLRAIVRFELRREVSIRDFEVSLDLLLSSSDFREAMVAMMNSLYSEIEENDVYASSFKARFGPMLIRT
jgi:hypothetical protein